MNKGFVIWPAGEMGQCFRSCGRGNRAHRGAFTILELMLAIMIFGMVLTAMYMTWLGIMKGTRVAQESASSVQRSRIAMRALEDALLTAQMYNANLRLYWFSGNKESLSLVARLPATFPGVRRYGDQLMRRVSFRLEPGKDGMNELIMSQYPMLMDMDNGQVEPYTIPLARNVTVFEIEYWDHLRREWVDEWKMTNQLPKLVQVSLGMGKMPNSSKPQDVVTRIVAVPSNAVTPELQGGMGVQQPPPGMNTNMPFPRPGYPGGPPGGGPAGVFPR